MSPFTHAARVLAVLLPSICFAQQLDWRLAHLHRLPNSRMVFDSARNTFVAVSGWADLAALQQFAEWDGADWRPREPAARPTFRIDFGLAFDDARNRVVLFGGRRNSLPLDDTWEYDGVDWTLATPAVRPPGRHMPAMTYDRQRSRIVVAGGRDLTTVRNDTWSWDGSQWTDLRAAAPPMDHPEMAWHPSTSELVLVGLQPNVSLPLTCTFDGTSWTQRAPITSPPPALDYRMATDLAHDRVLLLAGGSPTVWQWNGVDWAQGTATFDGRNLCAFAADHAGNALVHGGEVPSGRVTPFPVASTVRIDGSGTTTLSLGGPADSSQLQVVHDSFRQRVVCVGVPRTGLLVGGAVVWEWDGRTWTRPSAAPPPAAMSARMCFDAIRGRTVRFGGIRASGTTTLPSAALEEWDGSQWRSLQTAGPSPRSNHALAFDIVRGVVLLFGGASTTSLLGDTWQWNGTAWLQLAQSGPSPRSGHAMAADPVRGRIVLFGGSHAGGTPTDDTWEWNGAAWSRRSPAHVPVARSGHWLDYDLARHRVVLLGGNYTIGATRREFWEWDGADWTVHPTDLTTPVNGWDEWVAAIDAPRWIHVASEATWIGTPDEARVAITGTGCGRASAPALRAFGDPVLGSATFAVELHRTVANAPFLLGLGAGRASAPIGAGCTVYLPQLDDTRLGVAGPTGFARVPLPVPSATQLIGLEVSLQAGALDALAPLGFALSDAVVARIGH